jgi:hypothetical protein
MGEPAYRAHHDAHFVYADEDTIIEPRAASGRPWTTPTKVAGSSPAGVAHQLDTGLAPAAATAAILPIHLLPPAGGTGSIGLGKVRPAIAVGPSAAIVATMPDTVAPPASPIRHRFNVGLHADCGPESICGAAHAGLRGNRAAHKHEHAASQTDHKLRLHWSLLAERTTRLRGVCSKLPTLPDSGHASAHRGYPIAKRHLSLYQAGWLLCEQLVHNRRREESVRAAGFTFDGRGAYRFPQKRRTPHHVQSVRDGNQP